MFAVLMLLAAESAAVVVNPGAAKWTVAKDKTESVVIREDDRASEYLVRVPAGHVFRPHWHSVDERIVLLEGRLSLRQGDAPEALLEAGGYALLPAKEPQRTVCVSNTRCTFYVRWDGKLDFHPL